MDIFEQQKTGLKETLSLKLLSYSITSSKINTSKTYNRNDIKQHNESHKDGRTVKNNAQKHEKKNTQRTSVNKWLVKRTNV